MIASIEGTATSTAGFAGMAHWGPVAVAGVVADNGGVEATPRLVTSFAEFERVFGGLEPLLLDGGLERPAYLAHAARAFFLNGGRRLYVGRVFKPGAGGDGVARRVVPVGDTGAQATWRALWPGASGNVRVRTAVRRSRDVAWEQVIDGVALVQARRTAPGSVVEIDPPAERRRRARPRLEGARLYGVAVAASGAQTFYDRDGQPYRPAPGSRIRRVTLDVSVFTRDGRGEHRRALGLHPDHGRFIGRVLDGAADDDPAMIRIEWAPDAPGDDVARRLAAAVRLAHALAAAGSGWLQGGDDGALIDPADLAGSATAEDGNTVSAGLAALAAVDDVAIVAAPDASTLGSPAEVTLATQQLISHAEVARFRMALVDAPPGSSVDDVRAFRAAFDSSRAALYHPWAVIADPLHVPAPGEVPRELTLPPSGFLAGIYARNDLEAGVHRAPANVALQGVLRLESELDRAAQELLNPEGINLLRAFPGRGLLVWGARTMTSDPEWKYVPVRRLLMYLEHSIDRGTQWAVFEPNGAPLWASVRASIEDFLFREWKNGTLLGVKPEEAYFVKCDRTTMTQADIDNGRLIALVGVAPVRPAEFVIFRIGQLTADAG